MNVDIVIMAAGKGTRMKSALPKVLHKLAGRALLGHVLLTAKQLKPRRVILVTGHDAPKVIAFGADFMPANGQFDLKTVLQEPQLGTGHAVQQAVPELGDEGVALILNGDVPLIEAQTLIELIACSAGKKLALLTVQDGDPSGYGRILRQGDAVQAIVEHKDASPEQRAIQEWYSGVMVAPAAQLKTWLSQLTNDNVQGEYYLTDIVKMAVQDGTGCVALKTTDGLQVAGVNSPVQLQELERAYQQRAADRLMEQGVRITDAARFDLRGDLQCGQDVSIDVGCIFEGSVKLADGVSIGAHCFIANCEIGAGAVIHPFTHIDGGQEKASVGAGALIGPYARLRPGAQLGEEVHIGNFVEVKNSTLAKGAKANHLAYLGDATVGERVNYGAGSITANYDGANKHRTVIEDDVHIGSNCVLVAPVKIGAGGTVGGGSTITKDTVPGSLSVARGKQVSIEGWKRPAKKKI
ncbi:MAG: bifunctional UDP-N-acetylglucosamine diphosphorylase/glucosamine-1-phosphate N-acetyltransferase GlmU [Brachymonas sp.]|nr:bifunctional UDP-N-acetylglucosamine diphosphorylase/glucosamine-1-phosphate N-acetyltransferase GlmU [Brachymonas sp.]